MTKHKHSHDIGGGAKAVQHGRTQAIGPLLNVRHPKKFKRVPLDKSPAKAERQSAAQEEAQA